MVINSAANIAVFFGASGVIGLIVSVFNGAGRPMIGSSYDRFGRSKTMFINNMFLLLGGVVLTLGAVTGQIAFIIIGLSLMGIAYGGAPAMASASAMEFFGQFCGINPSSPSGRCHRTARIKPASGDFRREVFDDIYHADYCRRRRLCAHADIERGKQKVFL